jgi:hypothetical protein
MVEWGEPDICPPVVNNAIKMKYTIFLIGTIAISFS